MHTQAQPFFLFTFWLIGRQGLSLSSSVLARLATVSSKQQHAVLRCGAAAKIEQLGVCVRLWLLLGMRCCRLLLLWWFGIWACAPEFVQCYAILGDGRGLPS